MVKTQTDLKIEGKNVKNEIKENKEENINNKENLEPNEINLKLNANYTSRERAIKKIDKVLENKENHSIMVNRTQSQSKKPKIKINNKIQYTNTKRIYE